MRIGRVRVGHEPGVDLSDGVGLRPRHRTAVRHRDLGAEHGGETDRLGRFGEAHHPVEAVVVGDRQRLEPEAGRLGGQLLRVGGTVEEREVGVAVQLRVRHGDPLRRAVARPAQVVGRLERLALAAPRRPVTPGVPRRAPRRPPVSPGSRGRPIRQRFFEFVPGPGWVVEPHSPSIEHTFAGCNRCPESDRNRDNLRSRSHLDRIPTRIRPRSHDPDPTEIGSGAEGFEGAAEAGVGDVDGGVPVEPADLLALALGRIGVGIVRHRTDTAGRDGCGPAHRRARRRAPARGCPTRRTDRRTSRRGLSPPDTPAAPPPTGSHPDRCGHRAAARTRAACASGAPRPAGRRRTPIR